jgi:DNA-binding LytR/AlgR family response regulator
MTEHDNLINKIDTLLKFQSDTIKNLELLQKPFFVQDGDKKKVLRISDICFITTNPKGLDIFTSDGNKYINFGSISDTAEEFKDDPRLMKTHKSFIVNFNFIDSVKVVPGGRELTFKNLPPDLTAKVTSDSLEEFEIRFGKT